MKRVPLTVPEIGLLALTRVALGAGLGLLLGDRLTSPQRAAVGWTLFALGVATTGPLMAEVFGQRTAWVPPDTPA